MSTLSLRIRGLIALAVLVLFPLFVVLLVVLIAVAGWAALKVNGSLGGHILVLVIPLLLAVGAAVRDVVRARKPEPVPGHELTRTEHPALWAELDWLASAMDQPQPDRVVVRPTVNAFVTTAAGRREVMIGYPLLAGMSRAQLRSVLAHEMGHLAHGHTRTGGLAYRAGGVLEQTVARLDSSLVRYLVAGYYRLYLLISMSVLRDHERQADDWSARLAGGPDAASVFPTLIRLDAVWDLLAENYLPLAARMGAQPPLAQAIHRLSVARQSELDEFVAEQVNRQPSRWSTHPGDAERMRALRSAPPSSRPGATAEPAWQLLGRQPEGGPDPQISANTLFEIEAALTKPGTTPATWEQVVHDAVLTEARDHLGFVLDQFAAQAQGRSASLRSLLGALGTGADGVAGRLLTPLMRGDLPPEDRHSALEGAIASAAGAALLVTLTDQGRARVALRWDGPAEREYRGRSGEVLGWPSDLQPVAPLDGSQVARILDRLARDGADVDAPLGAASIHPEPGQGRPARTLRSFVSAGVAAVRVRPSGAGGKALHDVLVMDDGLLIQRISGRPYGLTAAFQARYLPGPLTRRGIQRLHQLADDVAGDPRAWTGTRVRGARWVPYPTIRQAGLHRGWGNLKARRLSLDLADGSALTLRWTSCSVEVGEIQDVLAAALHGRF